MTRADVLVAGAGLAGLVAARELARAGRRVLLLERRARPGGSACSLPSPMGEVDNSFHLMLGCYKACLDLCDKLGSAGHLLRAPAVYPLSHMGKAGGELRLHPLAGPLALPFALPGWSTYSPAERLGLARDGLRLLRHPPRAGQTVGDWLEDKAQGKLTRRFFDEWSRSVFNAEAQGMDAPLFLRSLRTMFASARAAQPVLCRRPLREVFLDPLLRDIHEAGGEVRFGSALKAIQREGRGFRLGTTEGDVAASRLLLALPPEALPALADGRPWRSALPPLQPTGAIVTLHARLRGWSGQRFLQGFFGSPWQFAFRTRIQPVVQEVQLVGSALEGNDREAWRRSAQDLFRQMGWQVLEEPWLIAQQRPFPLQSPAFQACRRGEIEAEPGLWLAGAWCDPDLPLTLEAAVGSGQRAARKMLADSVRE